MNETDDIMARLRDLISTSEFAVDAAVGTIEAQAAHITRLEERCAAYKGQVEAGAAEIERLKNERDEAKAFVHQFVQYHPKDRQQREAPARAFCIAVGVPPDFRWDGIYNWELVQFGDRFDWQADAMEARQERDEAAARADALQAEVERKDAALEKVSDWIQYKLPIPTYAATTMLGVVLNALQPQEPKPNNGGSDE